MTSGKCSPTHRLGICKLKDSTYSTTNTLGCSVCTCIKNPYNSAFWFDLQSLIPGVIVFLTSKYDWCSTSAFGLI